eukprot:s4208_g1.t1
MPAKPTTCPWPRRPVRVLLIGLLTFGCVFCGSSPRRRNSRRDAVASAWKDDLGQWSAGTATCGRQRGRRVFVRNRAMASLTMVGPTLRQYVHRYVPKLLSAQHVRNWAAWSEWNPVDGQAYQARPWLQLWFWWTILDEKDRTKELLAVLQKDLAGESARAVERRILRGAAKRAESFLNTTEEEASGTTTRPDHNQLDYVEGLRLQAVPEQEVPEFLDVNRTVVGGLPTHSRAGGATKRVWGKFEKDYPSLAKVVQSTPGGKAR